MLKDFSINASNNLVKTGFDLSFTSTSIDYEIQKLQIKLRTFLGEYFLDTTKGVDYFNSILVKNPDMDTVNALIKKQILSEPYIVKITKFSSDFNSLLRQLLVYFTVEVNDGQTINTTISLP